MGTKIDADKDFSPLYTNEAVQASQAKGPEIIDLISSSEDEITENISIFGVPPAKKRKQDITDDA